MISIKLPYPPSGNHMWKHTKSGHHYLTDVARMYYATVRELVISQGKWVNIDHEIQVVCHLSPPDRRRRDLDNAWKVISDSLTKANLWQDDKLIRKLTLVWDQPTEGGSIVVAVYPLGINVEN